MNTNTYIFLIISRSVLLRMRNISDKRCRENQKTFFVFSTFFFRKSCRLLDDVEKYCIAGQTTNYRMAHTLCMLDMKCYKYTFSCCVILTVFFTARMRLDVNVIRTMSGLFSYMSLFLRYL